jgi:hypothetical protein
MVEVCARRGPCASDALLQGPFICQRRLVETTLSKLGGDMAPVAVE